MTHDELEEMVTSLQKLGSDITSIEAKKAAGGLPRSLRETFSSFSNTIGGIVLLGLDEGEGFAPVGLKNPSQLADELANMASSEMEPPLRPLIGIHEIDGKHVVTAEVPELSPDEKPCFYKGAGMTRGSYIRVFDGDRLLTSYEVQLLLSSRGQPRNDEVPAEPYADNVLDVDMVHGFCERLRRSRPNFAALDDIGVLRRSRVLVAHEETDYVTMAGLMALGTYPQQRFPQLNITFVHFPTADGESLANGERFIDNVAIDGSIPAMTTQALAVLRRNMSRRAIIKGVGRQDVWEYPETALREAIVNALVHRDYSQAACGTQVQVEMYPDRLRIRNPGGLFGPVTFENLLEEGTSSSRNALLLRILEDVPLPGENRTVCENRGSGIRTMISALRTANMGIPKFDNRIATFDVTFPNHTLMSDDKVAWLGSLDEHGLTDSQITALAILRDGETITNLSYRNATGVDSRQATTELGDLVARGLVDQQGERRWARYTLSARVLQSPLPRQSSPRIQRADRRDEILHGLGDESLSRAQIEERTGLRGPTVARWLTILRKEQKVELLTSLAGAQDALYRRK